MLPLNALFNFGQNIVAFTVLSNVSPVSYSVVTVTKWVAIIVTSLLLLRNPTELRSNNTIVTVVSIIGVRYNYR